MENLLFLGVPIHKHVRVLASESIVKMLCIGTVDTAFSKQTAIKALSEQSDASSWEPLGRIAAL